MSTNTLSIHSIIQLELKNSRLIEEMKQMREAEAQKDKELYNLHVHNN